MILLTLACPLIKLIFEVCIINVFTWKLIFYWIYRLEMMDWKGVWIPIHSTQKDDLKQRKSSFKSAYHNKINILPDNNPRNNLNLTLAKPILYQEIDKITSFKWEAIWTALRQSAAQVLIDFTYLSVCLSVWYTMCNVFIYLLYYDFRISN